MTTTAILTAAGSGSRLGANLPKALVPVGGVPMVRVAASNLVESGVVDELIVTVPEGYQGAFTNALEGIGKPVRYVIGGETRQQSIISALQILSPGCTQVLVHDAARPYAPPSLIAATAQTLSPETPAVIPALPVTDTIKQVSHVTNTSFCAKSVRESAETAVNSSFCARPVRVSAEAAVAESRKLGYETVINTLHRGTLRAVQTPQAFDRELLEQAYAFAASNGIEGTDDASLVEAMGIPVTVIPGDAAALKITTPTDLKIATLLYGETR